MIGTGSGHSQESARMRARLHPLVDTLSAERPSRDALHAGETPEAPAQ